MTWSIIARDAETRAFGVAVTTKFFAVGALCPHAGSGIGALATQALVNPTFGPQGLRLLAEGKPAVAVVDTLIAGDPGREARQLHVMDAQGGIAAHTGAQCVPWCGHRIGDGFSVAGNMLVGAAVIDDTAAAYRAGARLAFAERLIGALEAGQRAGGDKRGKQSAALIIHSGEVYPYLDLRVDDHPEPLLELRRLYQEAQRYYLPFLQFLPSRASPAGVHDRTVIEAALKRLQEAQQE
jgi:uncharacterized Ntn-hydrolase superfamily protein